MATQEMKRAAEQQLYAVTAAVLRNEHGDLWACYPISDFAGRPAAPVKPAMAPEAIALIEASWADLRLKASGLIEDFYAALFVRHPGLRALFPQDMAPVRVRTHAVFNLAILKLRRSHTLEMALDRLAAKHLGHEVERQHFDAVVDVLMDTLRPHMDAATHLAWHEMLHIVARMVTAPAARPLCRAA